MPGILNILTFDVEDYFQVENFAKSIPMSKWDFYESRVERNTKKVLNVLAGAKMKATFFVLGWVAKKFPNLIKCIQAEGHEVASHGCEHKPVYQQRPEEFRSDIQESKKILEDIIQEPVVGYRAPSFSITEKSKWALEILMEEGFKYDSSFFPICRGRGKGEAVKTENQPHQFYPRQICFANLSGVGLRNHQGFIWEFPISSMKIFGKGLPFTGGGYFRLFPYAFVRHGINKINNTGFSAVVYLHPWELDPLQPRIKASVLGSFRHYVNLTKTEKKLKKLLDDFKFKPIRDFIEVSEKPLKFSQRPLITQIPERLHRFFRRA